MSDTKDSRATPPEPAEPEKSDESADTEYRFDDEDLTVEGDDTEAVRGGTGTVRRPTH